MNKVMKKYLAISSLCCAITLIAFGVHTDNIILMCIGGAFVGVYNELVYKQD